VDKCNVAAEYRVDIGSHSHTVGSNNEDVQSSATSRDGQIIILGSRELTSLSAPNHAAVEEVVNLSSKRLRKDDRRSSISTQPRGFAIPDQPIYTSRNHFSILGGHPQHTIETISSLVNPATQTWPINDYIKGRLLCLYLQEISRWCEGTDSLRNFSVCFGHLAKQSSVFAAAATTLAATREPQFQDHSEWLVDGLYQFSIHAMHSHTLESHEALLANVLLCYYCVYSARIEGLASHLQRIRDATQNYWNGLCDDLTYACFWAVARLGKHAAETF